MGNQVLFTELRQRFEQHLDLLEQVAADGDAESPCRSCAGKSRAC